MRILLLTVAGLSTRFSESIGQPTVKCLYYENEEKTCLLYRMLTRKDFFDEIIVVGGYGINQIGRFLDQYFPEMFVKEDCNFKRKIRLVYNEHFADYGSGYSFYKGVEAIRDDDWDELVFAEGDLFLDDESFEKVCYCSKNIITYNVEPVEAKKSVALYLDSDGVPRYIYDINHDLLQINEPFKAVYNSGQVWKFADRSHFEKTVYSLQGEDFIGTNLIPVNKYFGSLAPDSIEYIKFNTWFNCNTVNDFKEACQSVRNENNYRKT